MTQQYEQKVYPAVDPAHVEVTFNIAANTQPGNKSLGYGSIRTNGVQFFYSVYPSEKSPQGIFLGLPSKKKMDGTYENQIVILGFENRAVYEDLVLQEMAKQGVRVKPGTSYSQSQSPARPASAPTSTYGIDDDLPF